MKEILIFIAIIVVAGFAFLAPHAHVNRYQLVEANIQEVVGPKNVMQIQKNNALFRLDTKTGKTWRLTPFAQQSGDHVMGWEEVHEINGAPSK